MTLGASLKAARAHLAGPIARSSISGAAVRLGGMALMFVQAIIAARLLGAGDYGVVTLLLAIAQLASAFALFGFGSLAVAVVARRREAGDATIGITFARHAMPRIALLSLAVAPLSCFAAYFLIGPLPAAMAVPLLLVIPILAAIQLLRGVAVGLGRPLWAQVPGELVRPSLLVLALLGFFMLGDIDAMLFVLLYMVAAVIALIIAAPSIRAPLGQRHTDSRVTRDDKLGWNAQALPFLGVHLASILQLELATLLLGALASPEAVGLFQPIARISMLLMLPFYALSLGFNPKVAALHASGKHEELSSLARKHTRAATLVVAAMGAAIGFASPLLLLLFGKEFAVAAPLVWLLVLGRVIQAVCGPGHELLTMTGHQDKALQCILASIFVESCLGVLLIPKFGLCGAAVALMLGISLRSALLAIKSQRVIGV